MNIVRKSGEHWIDSDFEGDGVRFNHWVDDRDKHLGYVLKVFWPKTESKTNKIPIKLTRTWYGTLGPAVRFKKREGR